MAQVTFEHVSKVFPPNKGEAGVIAVDDLSLEVDDGEFLILVGPVGVRQVHGTAHGRRPREDQRRRDPRGRCTDQRRAAEGPRHRDGVPELRAVPAHDGGQEPGVRPEAAQDPARGPAAPGRRDERPAGPRVADAAPARTAQRRAAPARRDGSGAGARAQGLPAGRTAVEPGREAPRADARRAEEAAPPAGDHHHLRHARPGRGDDARRPHRRDERRARSSSSASRRTSTTSRPTCSSRRSSAHRP